jgi:hypothetical protein
VVAFVRAPARRRLVSLVQHVQGNDVAPTATKLLHHGNGPMGHEIAIDPTTVLDEEIQAQIEHLVKQRSEARWNGDWATADAYKEQIQASLGKDSGFRLLLTDHPRSQGGGSSWELFYEIPTAPVDGPTVLHLAHQALGMAVSCSERQVPVPVNQLQSLVIDAVQQLRGWDKVRTALRKGTTFVAEPDGDRRLVSFHALKTILCSLDVEENSGQSCSPLASWSAVETRLTGRKAADAAFWFAMAGVTDAELFELLTQVCIRELQRFGRRPSCRPKDIFDIVNRLAAAGVRHDYQLENVVRHCLQSKGEKGQQVEPETYLDLHSDHCALLLWNFSTRQRKQKSFLVTAAKHWECGLGDRASLVSNEKSKGTTARVWKVFRDPTLPLAIDVGSGMGISLLGLASLNTGDNWLKYNYIGVDLNALLVNYANGIVRRWKMDDKLFFVVDSAESLLDNVQTYPGRVERILIQFPTPYRLPSSAEDANGSRLKDEAGNSQLPATAADGFMVTSGLLQQAAGLLRKTAGELWIQTNCEDVAVYVRQLAVDAGFQCRDTSYGAAVGKLTQRTVKWIDMGGERAVGPGWSNNPLLPAKGRTETEIACMVKEIPVHRCILFSH